MITSNALGVSDFWDHFSELEKQLFRHANTKFPPYDIIRHDEENATVKFAVAGFNKDDLSITVHPHPQNFRVLEVAYDGESSNDAEDEKYEHRGIARRSFRTQLPLTEHWEVTGAFCEDGILTVNLHRLVPEEKKPKTIQIH
tara:strand:+ start:530 stop:955 length:426 start_codon:yes stop_codon:yes gene_type:complete